MAALAILPITVDDLPFVRAMLYEAAFWRAPSAAPPMREALNQPGLAVYLEGWGRPGDTGVIARIGEEPAGAVWVRHFNADDHGYGYVDELTPELSIAVVEDHRGFGIGRCLMTAMLVELRRRSVARVSLSVENDNPAHLLYESMGFVPLRAVDGSTTMTRTLT